MPPVIVGIAAGVAAAGVVSTAAAIAIGIGAAALTYAATPKFDSGSFANEAFSQQQMLRSPVEPRRGIYGRAMVSGPLVFAEETGTDNAYLHLVIPLAGHRCDGIEKIYFGDEVAWSNGVMSPKYATFARLKIHLGNQTTSDPNLTTECSQWTSAHVGFGVTYLYARLKFDTTVFPNGVPNIKALVRGKRIYDPRKPTHNWNDPATWEWSDNWALCCLDYNRFESGVGAAAHEIDVSYFAAAANDSDQLVEYKTGKFEKRYTCNGTYNQDVSPSSIMEKMLTAGAGMHVYVSGQYRLYAGVYQGPEVLVLTEDDAAGDIDVRPYTPRSDLCNAVRGTFVDPSNFYQPTDFPPYESSYYRAQDDGEYIDHDLDLPFTQSVWTAQRLGKLYLEQKRAGMQISMPVKMIGVAVSVGKVVGLSLPRLGIDGTFQIVDWQFDYGKPVSLILVETSPELFDYAMGSYTERDLTPNVILPNPATVPTPVGLQYVEYQDDPQWQGELTWSAPANNSSYRYVIEVSNGLGEVVYQTNADATRSMLPKLDTGFYTVSLWALNLFANRSNVPATITIGATLPAPVTGIEVIAGPLTLTLRPTTAAQIAQTTQFEILGSITNNIAEAALIGTGKDAVWPDRHPNTRYHVWARTINNYGVSSWYGPVEATTSADNSSIIDLIGNTFKNYTWFAWADDASGTGFTTVEALGDGKAYMGLATDKPTASPSGNWQDYTWSKIKADIGPVFTPEEEAKLDNLMAGKLPNAPDKDMLAAQDALNNPALANNLITALSLLNQGITAPALGGETPASAQAKADAAQNAAITAIDQIKIGGTNLVDYSLVNIDSTEYGFGHKTVYLIAGREYVFSAAGYATQLALDQGHWFSSMIYLGDWSFVRGLDNNSTIESTLHRSFIAPVTGIYIITSYCLPSGGERTGAVHCSWYKVEEGNKASAWSPSPNDIFSDSSAKADAARFLAVGDIAAGNFIAQNAMISTLVANSALFNQLQAQLAVFGGLAANSIAAKAITVDKLDVLSRNLINNFSVTGERTGWSDYPIVNHYHNGTHIWAMEVATYDGVTGQTAFFDIDHTKIYEVNFTFHRVAGSANSMNFLGITSDGGPVEVFVIESGGYSEASNFYFWNGTMQPGETRRIRSYIVGSEVDINAVPETLNAQHFCRLAPNCRNVSIRALNYYNGGVLGIDRWIHPSVTVLGGGQISANQIIGNSALFDKLKARIGAFGGLTANEIQADTALINKLFGTSALFNDLVARLAVFGGLTANSIASDAILGRHIKAGEKITSPIIEGGEVRLIGSNIMKIESATPFGPDSLVYWRGPRLLVGGNPDWPNIRKSNATRWTDVTGAEYFGGSLSAGVLKNGAQNTTIALYPAASIALEVGAFSTNGKPKSVVVSYSCSASYSQTVDPGNVTVAEILHWKVQRFIAGSWQDVAGASGTFTGTVFKEVNTETWPTTYRVSYNCAGSTTFVDSNASTANATYRIYISSHSRPFSNTVVSRQTLSLISTEQ
ncbi:hypothetical protein [Shewanella sp. SM32]|uniref:phage tail tip protein J-related protein n=1 Tax=Shewanella sp. SM32 TaxID=2912796 RepID=UPI0021DA932C|nr:hypothetical protein [Shewanella sp. SM32]MCU8068146.1 hypothetical protein [Shewanella sp. SM32]